MKEVNQRAFERFNEFHNHVTSEGYFLGIWKDGDSCEHLVITVEPPKGIIEMHCCSLSFQLAAFIFPWTNTIGNKVFLAPTIPQHLPVYRLGKTPYALYVEVDALIDDFYKIVAKLEEQRNGEKKFRGTRQLKRLERDGLLRTHP